MRERILACVLVGVSAGFLALGCTPAQDSGASLAAPVGSAGSGERPRHVLLVVVDTLRADHVGPGGYPRQTTPTLDALAQEGATFAQAITHSPRTRTAMGALMSGLLPSTTGLVNQLAGGEGAILAPGVTTLAERLAGAGFATSGVVSNVNVDPVYGFSQGFERYVALAPDSSDENSAWLRRTTEEVTSLALEELERYGRGTDGRPLLLYLHYLDPHSPYEPPREHQTPFRPESYRMGQRVALELSRYDGEIRHVDHALGRVLAKLDELGLRDETAVLITSDHGEEFADHGGWNHGFTHYDEALRVPLVLAGPGIPAGREITEQVRLVDVAPTLLDWVGLPAPTPSAGRSLFTLLNAEDASQEAPRAALIEAGNTPLVTLRRPPWKLVLDIETDRATLFDLARDPLEHHDVARDHPDVVQELRKALGAERAEAQRIGASIDRTLPTDIDVPGDHIERMKALGYMEDDS